MRQLLQNVSNGEITVDEVPPPTRDSGSLLVATQFSLISAGTERAVLELGRGSLVSKARARPDLVKKMVESVKAEGLSTTYAKVRGRLGEPNALGYSLAGVVLEAGDDAPAAPGDLVACAGVGYASHAEIVSVPRLLCARVPTGVAPEDAAYSTVASIALHGFRLGQVALGDVVAVIGLGLVGQITLELVRAAGCVPIGVDPDPSRVQLARDLGMFATTDPADLEAEALRLTSGRGADAVLVTAASKSSAPLATATAVARERAVVCIVGDVTIESPRAPLFGKELQLVVSRSYGPGRYDPTYEEHGIDYPAGYVRWTEGRNLEEVLRLMATGQLRPSRLTTHTFDFEDGPKAYGVLGGGEPSIGILLRYAGRTDAGERVVRLPARAARPVGGDRLRIGVLGAGAFARGVLLPALADHADVVSVANATGVSARAAALRLGAGVAATDPDAVLASPDVDAVLIATRHDTHADYVVRALEAGKHVFVEKPLALSEEELARVEAAYDGRGILMVGFNRRFAPFAVKVRDVLGNRGPMVITYRVSAGRLPRDHWTHDPVVGGGRIVGEVCHFVDLASYLCGGAPTAVSAAAVGGGAEPREDNVTATLSFADGSVATIIYVALGDPSMPKERVEVLGEAGAAVIDDFRELQIFRGGKTEVVKGKRDKGHTAEMLAFAQACRTGRQPWPFEEIVGVMRATFAIRDGVGRQR